MKISPEVITPLLDVLVKHSDVSQEQGATVHRVDELLAFFRDAFFGLHFEALGKDFTVAEDLEVYVTVGQGSGLANHRVEDPNLLNLLEGFLRWRTQGLLSLGPAL